jgi:hypothetical protein
MKPGLRVRYRPIVTVTARCCNCGSRYSHWWGTFKGYSLCGTCAGVPEKAVVVANG